MGGGPAATAATCDAALLLGSDLSNNGVGNTAQKSGYTFTYIPGTAISTPPPGCTNPGVNSYIIYAVPTEVGSTGQRGFFVDGSGTIRFSADGSIPTVANPALQ
jgi:hypothetical protein